MTTSPASARRTADHPHREPGSSEGMTPVTPARAPQTQGEKLPDPADGGLAMPHERDQSTDMTDAAPDPQVQQAERDLRRGLQDTGKSRPMDATYQKLKR